MTKNADEVSDGWHQCWAQVTSLVGEEFDSADPVLGPVIETTTIWRYLEPLEFDCALHYDAAIAARHGYPDVLVPATALVSFSLPAAWQPGVPFFVSSGRDAVPTRTAFIPPCTGAEPTLTGLFATGYEADYFGAATTGDRLRWRGARLLACEPKETSVGRGAFLTWESNILNQHDTVLSTMRFTYYRYEPRVPGAGSVPVAAPAEGDGPRMGVLQASAAGLDPAPTVVTTRSEAYWEDVADGEALEPVAYPLTVYRLVMAAGANRDFSPIHHNAEYARSSGAADMYANNLLLQGMWERSVRARIGLTGKVRNIRGFRMRSFNTPGDTLWVRGEVARKWLQDGEGWVEFKLRTENARGISVGPGSMAATLPLKTPRS